MGQVIKAKNGDPEQGGTSPPVRPQSQKGSF